MKTKKLLSLLLAIIMVIGMMTATAISANAGKLATWVKVEKYGKTFWYRTDKVTHNDGEHDESWECECWNLIVGKFAYAKPDEYDDGDWYDVYPCEHLVEYEPLTSLVMKSNPTKTTYAVGDALDLTGAKMTGTTISETSEDVNITSSMVSSFDSTTAGTKTVTVTYRNLTTSFNVTVAPKNECYLDLDSTTADILDSKKLDQSYNLSVMALPSRSYAVTKVRLSWEINDINATRMDNKVWDTNELKWVTASSNSAIMDKGTAKFTFENYSSIKVDAKVTFDTAEYEEGKKFTAPTLAFDEATGTDGTITLDTANGNSTYSKENVPTGEIGVTVTPVADDFKALSATAEATRYGTYTVTISQAKEKVMLTFTASNSHSTLSYDKVEYAYGESFSFAVSKESVVSIVGAGTSQSTLTVDGKTVTQSSATEWPCQWATQSGRLSNGTIITEATEIHSASK